MVSTRSRSSRRDRKRPDEAGKTRSPKAHRRHGPRDRCDAFSRPPRRLGRVAVAALARRPEGATGNLVNPRIAGERARRIGTMGIKEIQAYRAREVMTTGQFMKFWLDDYPGDDAYEVAKLLADVIEADAHCIHIANTNPDLDVWDEDQHKARRDLQSEAATTLRTLAASGKGLD